jgi:hypothetical protein
MIVAFVALFVAGAGSATAARLITGKQIKNSSITSKDVRNGSLMRRDFKSGQLPRGPQGLPGAAGRAGRDGFGQVTYTTGEVTDFANGPSYYWACPAGLVPIGGDAYAVDPSDQIVPGVEIVDYFYTATGSSVPNAWAATINAGGQDVDLVIEAICANSSRTTIGSAPGKSGGAKPAKPLK